MLTTLAAVLISTLVMVILMVGGVWWRQERIAYQPPRQWPASPANIRRIEYAAADGQQVFAFVLEPDDDVPVGVLLAFHGNADLAVWQIPWAREVARRTGWCVMLAEYRGYGGLGGEPSYRAIREDARAAWRTAQRVARELDVAAFALFGHSLGSAVATELAAEIAGLVDESDTDASASGRVVHVLLLQSPFTSARDMARIVSTPPVQMLWKMIARVHYDSRGWLGEIATPVSIAHGARDWLVPVAMGCELIARARTPGRLLVVDQAGHNDVAEVGGDVYWRWLTDALTDCLASSLGAGSTRRIETSD